MVDWIYDDKCASACFFRSSVQPPKKENDAADNAKNVTYIVRIALRMQVEQELKCLWS